MLYEINDHIMLKEARVSFAGISTHLSNDKFCDSDHHEKQKVLLNNCFRHKLAIIEKNQILEASELALAKKRNHTKIQVVETMKEYTFRDDNSIDLQFVEQWTNTTDLKIPEWSK